MAERQTDPSRLQGEALRRWYARSPADLEQEQQNRYDQRHREFFGAPGANDLKPVALSNSNQRQPVVMPKSGSSGSRSPVDIVQDALHDFQDGPKMQRPNLAQSFIPVIGPAWEAAADLQDGNYGGAAFNTAMAIGDALPVGVIAKGVRAASKGIGILKKGSVSAGAAAKQIRKAGLAVKGEEIHHSIPLDGMSRSAQDWRNHYALLKSLPKETHRRLHGSWNGKPQFDPVRRMWYGTTDWQKSVPTAIGSYAADALENVARSFAPPPPSRRTPQ